CVTCHDPHKNAETAPAYYEAKCLSCHGTSRTALDRSTTARPQQPGEAFRSSCPVNATKDCLTCHMPKVRYDWLFGSFTDHYIRVHTDSAPASGSRAAILQRRPGKDADRPPLTAARAEVAGTNG